VLRYVYVDVFSNLYRSLLIYIGLVSSRVTKFVAVCAAVCVAVCGAVCVAALQ